MRKLILAIKGQNSQGDPEIRICILRKVDFCSIQQELIKGLRCAISKQPGSEEVQLLDWAVVDDDYNPEAWAMKFIKEDWDNCGVSVNSTYAVVYAPEKREREFLSFFEEINGDHGFDAYTAQMMREDLD